MSDPPAKPASRTIPLKTQIDVLTEAEAQEWPLQ
jgi:hypothetical protein